MAVQNRSFKNIRAPEVEDSGIPLLGGYRSRMAYMTSFNVAPDDDIYIESKVPEGEVWRILGLTCLDFLGNTGALGEQSWDKFMLQIRVPRSTSPTATPADQSPVAPFTSPGNVWDTIWAYCWDGVDNIAWQDANGGRLYVRNSDPTFAPDIMPGGMLFQLVCEGATLASGAARPFSWFLLVDRLKNPTEETLQRFRQNPESALSDLRVAGLSPLLEG